MKLICPCCGSSTVRSRMMIYKGGTSVYSGGSSGWGLGFRRKRRPSIWLSYKKISGRRQTLLAKENTPVSLFPHPIIIIFCLLATSTLCTAILISVWLYVALLSRERFKTEFRCIKCGAIFIPR